MSAAPVTRLEELLIDRALQGLDEGERSELDQLLGVARRDEDAFDLAAAALHLALVGVNEDEAIPERLAAQAQETYRAVARSASPPRATAAPPAPGAPPAVAGRIGLAPWLLAAAAVAIAAVSWLRPGTPAGTQDADALRAALLARGGAVVAAWTTPTDEPTAVGAGGDVVWSDAEQAGVMRIVGLAVNDPSIEQYQLWIFDGERDDRHPVDGGVFDIGASGEALVRIDAKLDVRRAAAFAVTVEPPGGVVVSDRSRIALLAPVGG